MIQKFVKIDCVNGTAEVTWHVVEYDETGAAVRETPARCINYSQDQKQEFLHDVAEAEKYVTALGW